MFAVLKTGGKQYKVAKDDIFLVEKLLAEAGDTVRFDEVLMIGGETVTVGAPRIEGASVMAEVLEQTKGPKVISFVKRRRKHSSQRKRGHRQKLTRVRIIEIRAAGVAAPDVTAAAEAAVAETVVGEAAFVEIAAGEPEVIVTALPETAVARVAAPDKDVVETAN